MTAQRRTEARRVARALGACAAAAALLAAAPAHADSLSAGRVVTPPGVVPCTYSLAVSPAGGRAALLYQAATSCGGGPERLFARLGQGRDLGPALELEDRIVQSNGQRVTTYDAQAAVGPDGTAVAAWVARGRERGLDHLRVAIAPRGRRFGRPRTLSRVRFRAGYVPQIQVAGVVAGARGRAVVAWALQPRDSAVGSLRAAVRAARGSFGRSQRLGSYSNVFNSRPLLAIAATGAVVAAWRPNSDPTAAVSTLRPGRRRFTRSRKISRGDVADEVRVVSGPGGVAVSWTNDRRDPGKRIRLRVARLRRDGTFTSPRSIGRVHTEGGSLEVEGPFVAVPRSGPVATWQVFSDISEAGDGRKGRTRVDVGAFDDPTVLSPITVSQPGAAVGIPAIGALSNRTLVAWPETTAAGGRLRLAARIPGAGWPPARTVAESDGAIVIAASRASALVLWQPFAPFGVRGPLQLAVYRP